MRLINCTTPTPRLEGVHEDPIPHYVILSHTWGGDEVTIQNIREIDLQDMRVTCVEGREYSYPSAAKYQKLMNSCMWAFRHGYEYLWIDTCCIDKTSSAELQEAINSMYRWYHNSQICLAYLEDVDNEQWFYTYKSRWVTRGWTLQELLAPQALIVLTKDWVELGTKSKLGRRLSDLTEIDLEILEGKRSLRSASLAQRMSWAAGRQTTRKEDRAYSLLGIFDVNMSMLYGEGEKAFLRLQEEILKSSNDQSLLAWYGSLSRFGVLADSPDKFANGSKYLVQTQILPRPITVPTSLSNKGLQIELICWRGGPLSEGSKRRGRRWVALLECTRTDDRSYPVIILEEVGGAGDRFVRIETSTPHAGDVNIVDQHKNQMFLTYEQSIYGMERIAMQSLNMRSVSKGTDSQRLLGRGLLISRDRHDGPWQILRDEHGVPYWAVDSEARPRMICIQFSDSPESAEIPLDSYSKESDESDEEMGFGLFE